MHARGPVSGVERALVLLMLVTVPVAHLGLVPVPWLGPGVLVALTAIGVALGLGAVAGLGLFAAVNAITAELGVQQPVTLILAAGAYVLFDRLSPSPARDGWLTRGRFAREVWIAIAVIVVGASTALLLWQRWCAGGHMQLPLPHGFVLRSLAILGGCVLNAIGEEIEARALHQGALERVTGSRVIAVVGQALIFGSMHFHGIPSGWSGVVLASLYGLTIGALRLRAGGLVPAIVAHTFADLTIVAMSIDPTCWS